MSWLIASQHVGGSFLHSQCCVLAMFCHCLRSSIPVLPSKRKQLLWTRLVQVLQCMVCKEARFEWGQGTTRLYLGFFLDRVGECLDFSSFVNASNLRDLTLTQVLPMAEFCCNTRRTVLDQQLQQLMPGAEWMWFALFLFWHMLLVRTISIAVCFVVFAERWISFVLIVCFLIRN